MLRYQPQRCLKPWGVLPYKGLMGMCGQPGYVFQDFCLKQGIEFIIFYHAISTRKIPLQC